MTTITTPKPRTLSELMRHGTSASIVADCTLDSPGTIERYDFTIEVAVWLPPGRVAPTVLDAARDIIATEIARIDARFDWLTARSGRWTLQSGTGSEYLLDGQTETRRDYAPGVETAPVAVGQVPTHITVLPDDWPHDQQNCPYTLDGYYYPNLRH